MKRQYEKFAGMLVLACAARRKNFGLEGQPPRYDDCKYAPCGPECPLKLPEDKIKQLKKQGFIK